MEDLINSTNCLATLQAAKTEAESARVSTYELDKSIEALSELVRALAKRYAQEVAQ